MTVRRNLNILRRETGPMPQIVERAEQKANEERRDFGIKEDDFRDLYGDVKVDTHLAEVARLEALFASQMSPEEKESLRMSGVLEAIMFDHIELSNWLGENASSQLASKYDDYKHGIDMIVERDLDEGTSVLGLGIDVTRSKQQAVKKIDRFEGSVRSGDLGRLDYFQSELTDIRGEMNRVPRVVVGVSNETLERLARLWVDDAKKELATDRVQLLILHQIHAQLKHYYTIAEHAGHTEVAAKLLKQTRQIDAVIQSPDKKELAETIGFNPYTDLDPVFQAIMSRVQNSTKINL